MKEVALEERTLAAAVPMDAERFSVNANDRSNDTKNSRVKVGEKVDRLLTYLMKCNKGSEF